MFIDHRHKQRKENKRKLYLIIIKTLKATTIFFTLFDKVLLIIHVTIKKKKKREKEKSIVKRQQNTKQTDAPVKHITEPKKKFLVSITYSVMLSCSLIIDIKKEKKTRGNYV